METYNFYRKQLLVFENVSMKIMYSEDIFELK